MLRKGRKLVALVKQNDENRPPQEVSSPVADPKVSEEPESYEIVISEPMLQTRHVELKLVKHPTRHHCPPTEATSEAANFKSAQENGCADTDSCTNQLIPTSSLVALTNKIVNQIPSNVTLSPVKINVRRRLFSESPPSFFHQDLIMNEKIVVTPGKEDSGDLVNKINSPSLLSTDDHAMLPQSPIASKSNITEPHQVSPKPGTSKEYPDQEVLRQDLYLSDSSDSHNDLSPYNDSGSSYCPTPPPCRSYRPLQLDGEISELSDVTEVSSENQPKRRKMARPETWKRNVLKSLRQTGQGYTTRNGKYKKPKTCKPTDCSKCRYKCNSKFGEYLRRDICEEYWKLGDTTQQKIMLSNLIKHVDVLRVYTKAKKNRTQSRQYWLFHESVGKHRVCQKFFVNTFHISTSIINDCSKNKGQSGCYIGNDNRKGKIPVNITSEESTNFVKEHINQYPKVESHYCRKDSKKQYLDSDLNLSRLYRMYKDIFCPTQNISPVSRFVYRNIFHSYEPKLAFYKPKKDQCTKCNVYKRSSDKGSLQEEYDAHKKREKDSLDMKKEDKERCINSNGAYRAITFDLQAVLSVPFTGDCKIYYLRKLSLYNLTILDCHENTGLCYLWDECNGKKGSTEIGSILLKYLYALPANVTHVASFSDTCGGQNRNKYVTLIALYAVINIPNLETIDLKFMESGHSYLEADSMHACIERFRKHKSIFTVREYALIIGSARIKPKPYDVKLMKNDDFYDIKAFEQTLNTNTTKNIKNETVQWLKIKWLRLNKESPTSIFYKYDLNDPVFEEINICKARVQRKRNEFLGKLKKNLKKAYRSLMPISQCKKKDLLTLLKDGVIPADYEQYFKDLPSTAAEIANVNCTDTESSDNEELDQDDYNIEAF